MNSHFISRIILKNFSNSTGEIKTFDKESNLFVKPNYHFSRVGYIKLSEDLFTESESRWNRKIENKIGNLLQKHKGDVYKIYMNVENHLALNKLIALHFVRSFFFLVRLQEVASESTNKLLRKVPDELRSVVANDFLAKVVQNTPNIMDDLYNKTKNHLNKYKLELVIPSKKEKFIIGDIPIINNKQAIKSSEFLVMPLSPDFAISVARKNGIWNLSTKDTRKLKKMTKRDSIRYWFCKP